MTKFAVLMVVLIAGAGCAAAEDPSVSRGDRTVVIQMRDNHFEPDRVEVEQGETVSFRFTNIGKARHDAFIGDEDAQREHGDEMRKADDEEHGGGHVEKNDDAITVEPNKAGRLTYTFGEPGKILIGCHEPGHYEGGMTITVVVA